MNVQTLPFAIGSHDSVYHIVITLTGIAPSRVHCSMFGARRRRRFSFLPKVHRHIPAVGTGFGRLPTRATRIGPIPKSGNAICRKTTPLRNPDFREEGQGQDTSAPHGSGAGPRSTQMHRTVQTVNR